MTIVDMLIFSEIKSNNLYDWESNCSQFSNEYISLKILESHLSYGMSSVLFKLFRETNGLTYDVGVFNPKKEKLPFLI